MSTRAPATPGKHANRQDPATLSEPDIRLQADIRTIHQEPRQARGSSRMTAELRRRGRRVNHKRAGAAHARTRHPRRATEAALPHDDPRTSGPHPSPTGWAGTSGPRHPASPGPATARTSPRARAGGTWPVAGMLDYHHKTTPATEAGGSWKTYAPGDHSRSQPRTSPLELRPPDQRSFQAWTPCRRARAPSRSGTENATRSTRRPWSLGPVHGAAVGLDVSVPKVFPPSPLGRGRRTRQEPGKNRLAGFDARS